MGNKLKFALLFSIFVTVPSCSPLDTSSSVESDEDLQRNLEIRIKKTNKVRLQISSIQETLQPLDALLTDISNVMNSKVSINGNPADRIHTVIIRLREILKESTKDLVQYREDGAWFIERELSLPLGRKEYECKTSKVFALGRRVNDHEQLSISLKDCSSPEPINITTINLYSDRIESVFYPEILDGLIDPKVKVGSCTIRVQYNKKSIECDPVVIKANEWTAEVSHLKLISNSLGLHTELRMQTRNSEDKTLFKLEFTAHPGEKSRLDIHTQD
jgi:hypothetical protein